MSISLTLLIPHFSWTIQVRLIFLCILKNPERPLSLINTKDLIGEYWAFYSAISATNKYISILLLYVLYLIIILYPNEVTFKMGTKSCSRSEKFTHSIYFKVYRSSMLLKYNFVTK